jgi:lysophospholipase L1-like esterase
VADDLDVPMLDLLPLLRTASQAWVEGRRKKSERLFYDWCHHTPRGNQLIAEWVHEFLQEHVTP